MLPFSTIFFFHFSLKIYIDNEILFLYQIGVMTLNFTLCCCSEMCFIWLHKEDFNSTVSLVGSTYFWYAPFHSNQSFALPLDIKFSHTKRLVHCKNHLYSCCSISIYNRFAESCVTYYILYAWEHENMRTGTLSKSCDVIICTSTVL
jgi:hypothetical protein